MCTTTQNSEGIEWTHTIKQILGTILSLYYLSLEIEIERKKDREKESPV